MKRKLFIYSAVIALAVVFALVVGLKALLWQPKIGFYGLDKTQIESIVAVIDKLDGKLDGLWETRKIQIIEFDSKSALEPQIRRKGKPGIIFLPQGVNSRELLLQAERKKAGIERSKLDGYTASVRSTAITDAEGRIVGVPLLLDHYEIALSTSYLAKSGIREIKNLGDVETFATKSAKIGTMAPILFAGKDDRQIIDITGALTEALSGQEAWDEVKKKVEQAKSPEEYTSVIHALSMPNGQLHEAIQKMAEWYATGILYPQSFEMTKEDVLGVMDSDLTAVVIIPFSLHRSAKLNTANRYVARFIPSNESTGKRNLTAPEIQAIPLDRGYGREIISKLTETEQQAELSRASGLVPGQANCNVPDQQAEDVRYWVAATNAPLPALSNAAFADDAQRLAFAAALRSAILQTADEITRNSRGF